MVRGNSIGLDRTGSRSIGNDLGGVVVGSGSTNDTIGGTALVAGNVISGIGINSSGGGVMVEGNALGTLSTGSSSSHRPAGDPSAYPQGQTYLGFATVITDCGGNAVINVTLSGVNVPSGQVITATATDASENTSEFSSGITVT